MEVRVIPLDGEDFFIPIDEAESLRAAGKLVHDGQFYRVAPPPKKPLTFAEWAKFAISLIALAAMGVCILASLVHSFYAITNKLLHIPFNTYVGFFYGVVFTAMAIHIYNVCRPKN